MSVEAQTHENIEVILVDDGSTDGSLGIAQDFGAHSRFNVQLTHHGDKRNHGIARSRNVGLSLARGQFVAFIDADDAWAVDKLTDQIAIFSQHPELDLVCGATLYWRSWNGGPDEVVRSGHVQNEVVSPPQASLNVYPLGRAPSPCPSDFLVRREALAVLGGSEAAFDAEFGLYEDQSMLAKLFLHSKVMFSDQVWIKYRVHADSCSANVLAAGRYYEVRAFFLDWLKRYVRERSIQDDRLIRRIRNAQWRLRYTRGRRALSNAASMRVPESRKINPGALT